jgi:signal transduction histidine kinase
MIPFMLAHWFRVRMIPLVILAAIVVQVAAPLSYYLTERHEMWQQAHTEAERIAVVLHGEIEQRPVLWPYNVPKLLERLAAEGMLGGRLLEIRTGDGRPVPLEPMPMPRRPLWGRAEVRIHGELAALVYVAHDLSIPHRTTLLLSGAFAVLAALLGAVLYLLPMRAISLAERRILALLADLAVTLQEEERCRIARDLHDGAGQALTAARLRLLALERTQGAPKELSDISRFLDDALSEVRRSVYMLAPPELEELGLAGALHRHCAAFAQATSLKVHCDIAELPPLPQKVASSFYRIVQEALANSVRHAKARRAWVELAVIDGRLHLVIYDDGSSPTPPSEGHGLWGIRERARLLGGATEISWKEGTGLRIEVSIPL